MDIPATAFTAAFDDADAQMRRLPTESLYSYLTAVRLCQQALDVDCWASLPNRFKTSIPKHMENILDTLTGYYRSDDLGSRACTHCRVAALINDLDWYLHTYSREGEDVPFEPFLNAAREAIEDLDCPSWTH